MLTSGDIQFQSAPQCKFDFVTKSIVVMFSGDANFHSEIYRELRAIVRDRVEAEPHDWWRVKDVMLQYLQLRAKARVQRAELALLRPLGLDIASFRSEQRKLEGSIAERITRDLIEFPLPEVATIIVGVDEEGPHIYTTYNDTWSCSDVIGFAAVGSGYRHAESEFMLSQHAWNTPMPEALLRTYFAKKRAEVAPGVGADTDMFMIGAELGASTVLYSQTTDKLEHEYKKMREGEIGAMKDANAEISNWLDSLGAQAAAQQQSAEQATSGSHGSDENTHSEGSPPGKTDKGE